MFQLEPKLRWPEVESRIHRPGLWLAVLGGTIFSCSGGFLALVLPPPGIGSDLPHVAKFLFAGAFASVGILLLGIAVYQSMPTYIRHADSSLFPQLSTEPILQEGAVCLGGSTHQILEQDDAWLFRPDPAMQRGAQAFVIWFGVPFCIGFSALLAWVFHGDNNTSWFSAIVAASAVTAVCGGSALCLMWWIMRLQFQTLASVTIPKSADPLEIELPKLPASPFQAGQHQRLRIPREELLAVQLCPCLYALSNDKTWGIQGLLVVAGPDAQEPRRIPILLNGDFVRSARLLKQLAIILNIPFLFHADEAGWKKESQRAKSRVALKSGGM